MMTKIPPWSHSSLSKFETCPKQYYHVKVAKDINDVPTEASTWGNVVHKHMEDRVNKGTPLPQTLTGYEAVAAMIADRPGEKLTEQQLAVDSAFRPVEWNSDTAWCRGIIDVGVLSGPNALLLDWKTGKRKPDSSQLKLFAALAFSHYPELQVVHTGFVWLKENKVDKERFAREQVIDIWREFAPRVAKLERSYMSGTFLPRPSGLCRNYCPVPKHKCEYSGRS